MTLVPPAPPLEDGTIRLRLLTEDDVAAVAGVFEDPEWVRWFGSGHDPAGHVERAERGWAEGTTAWFAICEAGSDGYRGEVAVRLESRGRGTLEYWVAREARGRGLAARAVRLVTAWAFADLGLGRVQLWTEPDNTASQRVAEAAGFTREGVLRGYDEIAGGRVDSVFYARLPGDP
jgi:RimJ/RimL family protein N-acetyltransferase